MTIASIKTHGRGEGRSPRASDDGKGEDYSRESAIDIVRSRAGWLVTFCAGLVLAAFIVDEFEDVLARHVQLSFFVPLIMGHGGNTGSQSVSMIIRALALKQVTQRDLFRCVLKESIAGMLMGGIIGVAVLCFSFMWSHLSPGVGLAVCIALPIISLFANGFGAFLTIMADRFNMDPAVTSVPLMTTIVDTTGLIIYFYIAECIMDTDLHAAEHGAAAGLIAAKTAGALAKSGLVKTGGHGAAKAAGKVVATGGRLLMQLMNGR